MPGSRAVQSLRRVRADPESEMLRLCARTALTLEQAGQLRRMAAAVTDWDAQLRRAAFHGVLPLLAAHVDRVASSAVPPAVLERLRDGLRRNTLRNVALTAELLALLAELEGAGVRAIPYKGPVLAATVYGHVGSRDFGDLDVLVHRKDVPTAKTVLSRRGYRPRYEFPDRQEAALIETGYEHPFTRPADGVTVEIQWGIVPRHFAPPVDHTRLWERAGRAPIGGRMVPSLSPEDLLLILTTHGAKHLWRRLGWVCDVAELLRVYPGVEWDAVGIEADRLGARRMLLLGLRLARDVLQAPLPTRVEGWLDADPAVRDLCSRVLSAWRTRPETWPDLRESSVFHLQVRERQRDRLRYCVGLATATTPGDWSLLVLPRSLFALYYPLRVIRLAVKYGGLARRRLVTGRGSA